MSSPVPSPPRLAVALARRLGGRPDWQDVSLGDLHEEFLIIAAERGVSAARAWYWREVAALARERVRQLTRSSLRAVRSIAIPRGDSLMRSTRRELALALRTVIRQPRVSLVIIFTLALGLGANAAVFGMVDSLLLRPFPINDVDRLTVLSENAPTDPFPLESVSVANFLEWKQRAQVFDRLAAFDWWSVNVSGGDQPARVQGHRVSADFFAMLGVVPSSGRFFDARDEIHGQHRRVVISDSLWHRSFGAAPDVVGRTVRLDGETFEIIGVAPPDFDFPFATELWGPLAFTREEAANRSDRYLTTIARLGPGETFESAAAAMQTLYASQKAATPDAFRSRELVVRTFTDGMVDVGMKPILLLWQVAAVLVLVIGCTNVVNLLLAQGSVRQREFAVRLALGAGRLRLIRQLVAEGVVMSLAAVPLAMAVAAVGFALLRAAMPASLVRFVAGWSEMGVDWRVLLMTLAVACVAAIGFSLIPALRASTPRVADHLREGTRSITAGVFRSRLRRALVIAEVAIALPLLIASGLAAQGAHRFASGPQGYDPDGVLRARMILPDATYPDAATRRQFVNRLFEQLRADPRVADVAMSSVLPSGTWNQVRALEIEGRPIDPDRPMQVNYRVVSPNYLSLIRVPILRGRGLEPSDLADREPVILISQSMARRYWSDVDPLGRRIQIGSPAGAPRRIVGITGDTIDDWFTSRETPTVYVPVDQAPTGNVNVVLRPRQGDPTLLSEPLRRAVAAVDPAQAVFEVMTLRESVRERTTGLRMVGGLMAVFGALALVLAAVGLYSVMASYVAQRRREIGIRIALGAAASEVLRQTVVQGVRLAIVGTAIGLVLAFALARVMENALFGVIAAEMGLFAAIAGLLLLVAGTASLVPARQASRVDPVVALRD